MSWALNLSDGVTGTCPDCGRPSFVQRSSLLYDTPVGSWVVDPELLRVICKGVVKCYRVPEARKKGKQKPKGKAFTCINCRLRVSALHWLEVVEGGVAGPFCKQCLREVSYEVTDERGVRDDLPVYIVSGSRSTLVKARAILLTNTAERADRIALKDEDAVLL